MTATEFTCAAVIGRSCIGIGMTKYICAPVTVIPSLRGVSSTFSVIQKTNGKSISETLETDGTAEDQSDAYPPINAITLGGKKFYIIPAGVIYTKTDLSNAKISSPSDEARDKAMMSKQGRSGMVIDDK